MAKQRSGRLSIIPAAAIFDERLCRTDLAVLCALGAYANRKGRCWPATTTLAGDLRVSTRMVRRCLRKLENCGYVNTEHREGQRSVYTVVREATDPGHIGSRVEHDPGHPGSGGADTQVPGTPDTQVPPKDIKKDTLNGYAFAGKIIRLNQHDFDTWADAYRHIDLRAQLQALDDYYDNNLTGADRNKWFARCSQALAKKNERARIEAKAQREEPCDSDVIY